MSVYENLSKLNITIPDAPSPVGTYVAYKKVSNFLFISGQISIDSSGKITKGKIGKELSIEDGKEAAKLCAINIIAQAKKACNEKLENILSCIKLTGYVNSTSEFTDQPKVINGASELISAVFGDKGKHTRAAISANSLPLGAAVEIEAIFELK
jgi:enamine deaminase RidA (YjgF/YER057c/UK114 family)